MPNNQNPPTENSSSPQEQPQPRPRSFEEIEQGLLDTISFREKQLREAFFNLVVFYSRTGRQEKALQQLHYLMAMTDNPGEKAHYCMTMGQLMEQRQDHASAVEYYRQALALEPIHPEDWYFIHNNLGYSLNMLGRFEEGERFCRTAIRILPQQYNAHKNLGIALEGQNKWSEAAFCYLEAIKASPEEPRAFTHLEVLLKNHPGLLQENPRLVQELEEVRQSIATLQDAIQGLLNRYRQSA